MTFPGGERVGISIVAPFNHLYLRLYQLFIYTICVYDMLCMREKMQRGWCEKRFSHCSFFFCPIGILDVDFDYILDTWEASRRKRLAFLWRAWRETAARGGMVEESKRRSWANALQIPCASSSVKLELAKQKKNRKCFLSTFLRLLTSSDPIFLRILVRYQQFYSFYILVCACFMRAFSSAKIEGCFRLSPPSKVRK